jgi:Spy/CpxP family protein refolding chaperone
MVRPLRKLVLTLGALALAAAPALAQQPKGRGGFGMMGMGGGPFFLMAENVQKDMKLSDEQVGKVQDTLRQIREKHADELQGLRDLDPQERPQKAASVTREMNDEVKKDLHLSAEQSKRFDQISLQTRGLMAFADPRVQETLNLTAEQKSQIREIAQSSAGAGRGAFNKDASQEERQEAMRKAREARQENLKKVHALLTDDQKKEWKELTGEPIEIEYRRPGQ